MIKLEPRNDLPVVEEKKILTNEQVQKLYELQRSQDSLRLGQPNVDRFVDQYRREKQLLAIKQLKEDFPVVKNPPFPREHDKVKKLPKIAMARLYYNRNEAMEIKLSRWGGVYDSFHALLPVLPATVQELVRRVNRVCSDHQISGKVDFWIIFEPTWEKGRPPGDPVLVAYFQEADAWLKIAQWDGDADLIASLIDEK